jgi:hypothetical protein
MNAPPVLCNCAPDADHHQYDVWGQYDEGSLEGSGDGDDY